MKNLITATTFALLLAGGAAFAQATTSDPNASDKLNDPVIMKPFYQDEAMTKLRTDEELKTEWQKLNAQDQAAMKAECQTSTSVKYQEFCDKAQAM